MFRVLQGGVFDISFRLNDLSGHLRGQTEGEF